MRTPLKLVPLAVLALVSATLTASVGTPAQADGPEQIVNGAFTSGHAPWWGTGNLALDSSTQQLCTDVPGGTVNPWDAIIGQDNIPLVTGESYTFRFKASATPERVFKALVQLPVAPYTQYLSANPLATPDQTGFEFTFTSPVDLPNGQVVFQIGGSAVPWHLCLDDISLTGGAAPPVYTPNTGPRVRVNQVGYLTHGPKRATLVTDAASALPWQLVSGGTVVASGQTAPAGPDAGSGQSVHTIDFSGYAQRGSGYTLVADGETSRPFDIGDDLYSTLRTDALKFYYPQRSGIAIDDALRPGYGRAAGHVNVAPNTGDTSVGCQPGVCDYTLNVAGGWYDAGDHGKYVVNGGISVYQLMSEFERTKYAASSDGFTDGELAVPESGNGVPDLLDEARWEMDFLLSMQVPAGRPLAGMAHHKVHDNEWTGLPLLPAQDPKLRELHPPSTAATLNLAAATAQAARLFAPYDAAYAQRNLTAAKTAYAAAVAHPAIYASPADGNGGGTYDDSNVTDEFYWAAAELYLTTGEKQYLDAVLASPQHTADIWRERGFDWGNTAQLGRLDLATVPSGLPDRARVRASVVEGAEKYLANVNTQAYGLSYAPSDAKFDWGSNNLVLNNLVVVATAYDLTGDARFQQGVAQGMDYLLGRNALNISYVTGYGEVNSHNQHSRWYSHQLNPDLPSPPKGTLSGGPNSGIQDPVAQQKLQGCAAQFCYIDDIESWSTNELTINWNSPLAWISAFLAGQGDASAPPKSGCRVSYTKLLDVNGVFASTVTVTNTSKSTIDGWSLRWAYWGGQNVTTPVNAKTTQSGATVTASNQPWNARIKPGQSVTFALAGQSGLGVNADPTLFTLNGKSC